MEGGGALRRYVLKCCGLSCNTRSFFAAVVGALPEEAQFNRVLGATAPDAVTGGHLEEALDWVESHPAIRNLVRAGFKQMAVRAVWGR